MNNERSNFSPASQIQISPCPGLPWPGLPWSALILALALLLLGQAPAKADFRLCNTTPSHVGIALGYKDLGSTTPPAGETTWVTEGWTKISPGACETLRRGDLPSRYYYLYAIDYDRGGEWSGSYFMCSKEHETEFTIRGAADCPARGFERSGFFEVDTGEKSSWTVKLTDGDENEPGNPNATSTHARTTRQRTE